MAKQTKCYVLVLCSWNSAEQQILSVYTSAKAADKNKSIYEISQAQVLLQRNMFVSVLACNFNKVYL